MKDIKISIGLLGVENMFDGRADGIIEVARIADAAGIDQVIVTDHVIMSENTEPYPYGKFPLPVEYPWFEPMTLLSAIAGATSSIRLTTGVLISPLRSAVLLAKIAATLDNVSNGRLDLGVGLGWQREEYDACGVPFSARMTRLENQLQALKILWNEAPASFESDTVNFSHLYSKPFPIQPSGVPIWIGMAPKPRTAKLLAETAVGWIPMASNPEEIKRDAEPLREAFTLAGRDPDSLRIRASLPTVMDEQGNPDLDRTLEGMQASIDADVTDIQFMVTVFVRDADKLPKFFERVVEHRQ